MPVELTRTQLLSLPRPGQTVFVGGALSEPRAILDAWRDSRSLAGVRLIGAPIPGLNDLSPAALGDDCRMLTGFLTRALAPGLLDGSVALLPMQYSGFHRWLADTASIDLAVFQVAPPDASGLCSLGPCADHVPALIAREGLRLVAQVNPELPPAVDGCAVPWARLHAVHHAATALPAVAEGSQAAADDADAIARHVAALVSDGDCVQIGIGRVPDLVLQQLYDRRDLLLHCGLLSPAGLALIDSGAVRHAVTGAAIGDPAFYARAAACPAIAFRPVSITHDAAELRRYERLIAINGALEVDLFGQVNCERVQGRAVASPGGINDFARAAAASPGGRSIIVLPATAASGRASRIVAAIAAPGLVTVQRGDVDMVVTEYGIADLRGRDEHARAKALIAIAAPEFREALETALAQRGEGARAGG